MGEEIIITVKEDSSATANHLVEVLCGNEKAAHLLAGLIHSDAALEVNEMQALEEKLDFELPLEKLAIWIDPIGNIPLLKLFYIQFTEKTDNFPLTEHNKISGKCFSHALLGAWVM